MNVLFEGPLGALLAKPWVDQAGLFGLKRWYMPLSRLWAAANAAGEDAARFRDQAGLLPAFWTSFNLRGLLAHHGRLRLAAETARATWETAIFAANSGGDAGTLDRQRRAAATRHLMTRAAFYPLLFPRRPATARWQVDPPQAVPMPDPVALYGLPIDAGSIEVSRAFVQDGVRECWLRAPTPSPRLRERPGSEMLYARMTEPADAPGLAGDRADLALSRPACDARLLWRRNLLRAGADWRARLDRRAGTGDRVADRSARPGGPVMSWRESRQRSIRWRHRRCRRHGSCRCSARPIVGCPTTTGSRWRGAGSCRRGEHLPLSARPSRHAGPAHARSGAVR